MYAASAKLQKEVKRTTNDLLALAEAVLVCQDLEAAAVQMFCGSVTPQSPEGGGERGGGGRQRGGTGGRQGGLELHFTLNNMTA